MVVNVELGNMIRRLESVPNPETCVVRFDFGRVIPDGIDSWRGIYAELAVGYKIAAPSEQLTVKDFLEVLRGANGETFQGYKGGDFTMDEYTEVHVDNYGEYTDTHIVGIALSREIDGKVYSATIETRQF